MRPDVLARLRAADPCPEPVAYDESVAQRNIDAVVRTDLTVRAGVPVRRPRRRGWLAVAAVAVGLAVAGSVVGVEITRDDATPGATDGPWETFSANGVTFDHPMSWTSYPPGGASTMSFTLAYLSTTPFPPVCTTTTTSTGEMTECHSPEPDLSGGGVFVDWTYRATPGLTVDAFTGDSTVIAGVDARVDRTTLPEECRPTHAVAGVQAALASDNVLVMTACVGPGDVDTDLAAVDRMLASLQLSR